MPTHQQALTVDIGPCVTMRIRVPDDYAASLSEAKLPVPVPVDAAALIDTGASATCVDYRVLHYLGIRPIGRSRIMTPAGPGDFHLYPVRIEIPVLRIAFPGLEAVAGVNIAGLGIYALIGRDILSNFKMTYDGPGKMITIDF